MKSIQFEAMLLRWSETSNGGATIVLQLTDPDELEPFKLMTLAKGKIAGQRLQIVAVEIDDQEEPKVPPAPGKGGQLSVLAARWCQDPEFQYWITNVFEGRPTIVVGRDPNTTPEQDSAMIVRRVCEVKSRAELDHNTVAAHTFEYAIRKPYMEHLQRGPRFLP